MKKWIHFSCRRHINKHFYHSAGKKRSGKRWIRYSCAHTEIHCETVKLTHMFNYAAKFSFLPQHFLCLVFFCRITAVSAGSLFSFFDFELDDKRDERDYDRQFNILCVRLNDALVSIFITIKIISKLFELKNNKVGIKLHSTLDPMRCAASHWHEIKFSNIQTQQTCFPTRWFRAN